MFSTLLFPFVALCIELPRLHLTLPYLALQNHCLASPHIAPSHLTSPRLTSSHLDAPFRLVVRCLVLPDIILSCFGHLVRYSLTLPGFIPCNFALILKGSDQKAQKNANASVVYVRFM